MGEAKRKALAAQKQSVALDTFGGRIHVEWYPEAAVTPLGQLPFFIEFLKVSGLFAHPEVFVEPTPIEAAQAFLRAVLDSPGVTLLPLGEEWPLFEHLCTRHGLSGNAIPDAWIAAAAQSHHVHLATFDKGFRRLMKASLVTVLQP